MPERNGLSFLEVVREEHPEVPFILYTGKGSEESASGAISAGVTDYLQKGTGDEQYQLLTNRIENAVVRYRAERSEREREEPLSSLFEGSTDIITVIDSFGTVQDASPAPE